jgi:hypothetical protein
MVAVLIMAGDIGPPFRSVNIKQKGRPKAAL